MHRPVALVTGASSGLGAAFAERLAADGHNLIVVARRRERLKELADRVGKEHDADVRVEVADLTGPHDIARVADIVSSENNLELLVNNAGFTGYRPFVDLDPDEMEGLVQIHCIATARLTRAALPGMIERGHGSVVNIASLLAFSQSIPPDPLPFRASYAASKAFLVAFTVTLRHELEGTGARAMVCCPGMLTDTELHGDWRPPFGMASADVVAACLRGLELGDAICVPQLEDPQVVDDLHEAQRALFGAGRTSALAERYR